MATIYADANGNILRLLKSPAEEAAYPIPPDGTATTVAFDEATNAAVIAALDTDWNSHHVTGGKLQHAGADVTLAPPGQGHTDRLAVDAILAKLAADQALTPVELRVIFRHMARKIGLL